MTMESQTRTGREQLLQAAVDHFAQNGVHNQSLRGVAAAIGTSHRMLNYHFGSREGLLAAVVGAVEQQQRDTLSGLMDSVAAGLPRSIVQTFWNDVVDETLIFGPLVFELSAHGMRGEPYAAGLRKTMVLPWLDILEDALVRAGVEPEGARVKARLGLAVVNGLLFDLLLTGDRTGVTEAHTAFVDLIGVAGTPRKAPR